MNLAPTAPGESNIKNIDLKNIDLFLMFDYPGAGAGPKGLAVS